MSTPDLETRLRETFAAAPMAYKLDPGTVLREGGRRRRRRHIVQAAVAAVVAVLVGGSVAVATVPPTGTILSPIVAAIRRDHSPWMEVNGQRYVMKMLGQGPTPERAFRIYRVAPDGGETDFGGPIATLDDIPLLGNGSSGLDPNVTFLVLPEGAHDISAQTPGDRYRYEISTMEITDPVTGTRLVAVAVGATYEAITQINGYTWVDAQGLVQHRDLRG